MWSHGLLEKEVSRVAQAAYCWKEADLYVRQIRHQFSKHTPPTLPFVNNNNGNNPYASNPPPPTQQTGSYYGQNPSQTNWNNNQYGQNPPPPSTTYQPSMSGQYGAGANNTATSDHEHGYEWEQAREAERLEREQGSGAAAPPGYDVAACESQRTYSKPNHANPRLTAQNKPGNANYAPPTGPPPAK